MKFYSVSMKLFELKINSNVSNFLEYLNNRKDVTNI